MRSAESARAHLFRITQMEHVAGTEEALRAAGYVQDELAKALKAPGVTVVMDAVKVLLAYPVNRSLSMRAGGTTFEAPLSEPALPSDATSDSRWRNMTFTAYSPSGHVEAELVYANYGSPDDFDALDKMGVSVKGKVVLVRYGTSFRGLKAMLAERRGALGVILYSDPMEVFFSSFYHSFYHSIKNVFSYYRMWALFFTLTPWRSSSSSSASPASSSSFSPSSPSSCICIYTYIHTYILLLLLLYIYIYIYIIIIIIICRHRQNSVDIFKTATSITFLFFIRLR